MPDWSLASAPWALVSRGAETPTCRRSHKIDRPPVTGLRQDGTTFPLQLSVGEMTVSGDRTFTGILHDLNARVHIEEQLREQTSLARLGEMAAVIAHEVKNPLASVRGAIQVIGTRLLKESKRRTRSF